MNSTTPDFIAYKGRQCILLILFFLLILIAKNSHGDLQRYRGNGTLTEIENNDTAVIDKRGYTVDPSVLVVNAAGIPISLDELPIPTEVTFEYSYMEYKQKTMSPMVVFIQETKKKEANEGTLQ